MKCCGTINVQQSWGDSKAGEIVLNYFGKSHPYA